VLNVSLYDDITTTAELDELLEMEPMCWINIFNYCWSIAN